MPGGTCEDKTRTRRASAEAGFHGSRRDPETGETGGSYTVKRYRSTKSVDEQGWKHDLIQLVPDNPDRARFPILEFVSDDEADLQVKAEFIQMLKPST
jgi:hypothetical protein